MFTSLYFLHVLVTVVSDARSVISHWLQWDSLSESTSLSCSLRNCFIPGLPGQDSHQCIIHSFLVESQTIFEIKSLYVISQLIASTNRIAFWWILHTHTEWVPEDPASTHHFGQNVQNLENPSLTWGYFSLKSAYISLRLHRTRHFCLWTHFAMQTVFFTWHLATKLIILIHAKHKINGILGYHFSLFLCRLRKNSFNLFKFLCSSH